MTEPLPKTLKTDMEDRLAYLLATPQKIDNLIVVSTLIMLLQHAGVKEPQPPNSVEDLPPTPSSIWLPHVSTSEAAVHDAPVAMPHGKGGAAGKK